MEQSHYRTYTSVDLSAIRHNFHTVKSRLQPGCKILSVVKADGYGHGAVEVAKTLRDSDYFGVACIDEAIELRENGIETPILILGYTSPKEARLLVRWSLTQCAFEKEYLYQLQQALQPEQKLKIHLKIDTGMSRLGFYAHDEDSIAETAEEIASLIGETPSLEYEGIFTHFTSSDEPNLPHTKEQFACFLQVLKALEQRGVTFPLRHCANSGATLSFPETHLDMVRPGILLYGYAPAPEGEKFGFKPALELKAYVAQIHHVKAGDTVSYNRAFRAERPMDVATVCIGYGDGLHRALSGAPVLINGRKTKILGRICMDQCVIDVTGIPANAGDTVTFIGASGTETVSAADLADYADTIHYEILCSIGKRIPRIYHEK
ncbi:MAG: alanine racemase [Clostridia bacterium]|nr:alanine racemase [Clostridia bacterium]